MTFLQYLLPNGHTRSITIDRPERIEDLARKLVERGVELEIEILRTGEVSMTAETVTEEENLITLAHEIVPNGPEVPVAVDRLIEVAFERLGMVS